MFGGDHGARQFLGVIQLIFHNTDCHVNPYSITFYVGNIDCSKDTREILQKSVATELNEGLWLIAGKILLVHVVNNNILTTFLDEPPRDENDLVSFFQIWTLIAGDLAFFCNYSGQRKYVIGLVHMVQTFKNIICMGSTSFRRALDNSEHMKYETRWDLGTYQIFLNTSRAVYPMWFSSNPLFLSFLFSLVVAITYLTALLQGIWKRAENLPQMK